MESLGPIGISPILELIGELVLLHANNLRVRGAEGYLEVSQHRLDATLIMLAL